MPLRSQNCERPGQSKVSLCPMAENPRKPIIIIAGPNGAGKTTFATEYLPSEANCPALINADLIAAGLNPFQPERAAFQAGRMMLEMIDTCVSRGEDFAFETTLSGRGYARMIPQWGEQGYCVKRYFLQLPSPDVAIARVSQRVAMGGHHIPKDYTRRRFHSGWDNFQRIYKGLADESLTWGNGDTPDDSDARAALLRATRKSRRLAIALTGSVVAIRDGQIIYETNP